MFKICRVYIQLNSEIPRRPKKNFTENLGWFEKKNGEAQTLTTTSFLFIPLHTTLFKKKTYKSFDILKNYD